MENLKEILAKIDSRAAALQRSYYKNERYFDRYEKLDCLDNAVGNGGTYDLFYFVFGIHDKAKALQELSYIRDFYKRMQAEATRHGYGPRAAMMGFDISRPLGGVWVDSTTALRYVEQAETIIKNMYNNQSKNN